MKRPLSLCLALCFTGISCDHHEQLRREIAVLDATNKREDAAMRQYEADIAAHGGTSALPIISGQIQTQQEKMRPLELSYPTRERKWAAIAAEFARLKPAAEAYKAANLK